MGRRSTLEPRTRPRFLAARARRRLARRLATSRGTRRSSFPERGRSVPYGPSVLFVLRERFQFGDAFLRLLEVLTLFEFLEQLFVVGERFGFELDLDKRFGEVEIDGVAWGVLRILLQDAFEAIDRAWIPPLTE